MLFKTTLGQESVPNRVVFSFVWVYVPLCMHKPISFISYVYTNIYVVDIHSKLQSQG